MAVVKIGEVFKTQSCGNVVVVKYANALDVTVEFHDGHTKCVSAGNLRKGLSRNDYFAAASTAGYMGSGEYSAVDGNGSETYEHRAWKNMLSRCTMAKYPTYTGCSVCEDWLNFQSFAKWYTSQVGYGKGWHLDKDLTVSGNKVYSPLGCALVPQEVNKLLLSRKASRGEYPLGVSLRGSTYSSSIRLNGKNTGLGVFPTQNLAFAAYKVAKESYVKDVAAKHRHEISEAIYNNLMAYTVSITD